MIVLTGMHRSGTSLLSLWLQAGGYQFGPTDGSQPNFYEADEHNPRGYLEEETIIDLNSYLLTGAPRTLGQVSRSMGQVVYLAHPKGVGRGRRATRSGGLMRELVADRQGSMVKDPRFCLTLADWQHHTGGVEACLVAVRHPALVVDSLARRQRIPTRLGYRFWSAHIEALLQEDLGISPLFVDMDRLMTGEGVEGTAERIVATLGHGPGVDVLVKAFFDVHSPSLVRSTAQTPVPDTVGAVFEVLRSRCHSSDA